MKISVSNIAWGKESLIYFLNYIRKLGCSGVEIAPSIIWPEPIKSSKSERTSFINSIKKADLAKSSADARPEVFSPGNALDAKITELDLIKRKIKLSVKAAQIDEEKSLVAKFGEGATKSGATLKGIFEKALGRKSTKKKDK